MMTSPDTPSPDGALFYLDGELLVPTVLTQGPWYADTLHGSAMLAALARAAEQYPSVGGRQVVRLTVDMMRAAPIAPLRIKTSMFRSGKSIDHIDIAMFAGDELCVRGTALRMRTVDLVVDEPAAESVIPAAPGPDHVVISPFAHLEEAGPSFHDAIDVHIDLEDEIVWYRLRVPVVAGEPTGGFTTLATIADWTYAAPYLVRAARGNAPPEPGRRAFTINADTTLNAFRPMSGEWIGVHTTTHIGERGSGISSAHLFDQMGPIGVSTQSVLVRGPSGAPLSVKEVSG